jgi:hypothetical protein
VAIDATMALYGADLYLTGEVYTNSGSTSEGVIERITVDEWSL